MADPSVGYAALAVLLLLVLGVGAAFFLLVGRNSALQQSQQQAGVEGAEEDEDGVIMPQARARGAQARIQGRNIRRRAAAATQQQQQQADNGDSDDDDGSEDGSGEEEGGAEGAQGRRNKKQRNRDARREAREAARAAQAEREARLGLGSRYDEVRRQRDAEREAREQAEEEAARKAAEEKARQEEEEASKWMGQITVEAAGTEEADEGGEGGGMLAQFIDYLQARKTVPLEQLAADFRMRTSDVVERIQSLEAQGRITGIMDERGKFIYISRDEMQSVADYLNRKGRVPITDLAAHSSTLIDLEPKAASGTALHADGADLDLDGLLEETA